MRQSLVSREQSRVAANRLFWLRNAFRLLAVSMAGAHAWAAAVSHSMNADGISYLDIGDAYFRGDWGTAINAVWSPLYSWIVGAVLWVLQPPLPWEFPTVHLVNFLIFVATLFSFEFLWGQLAQEREKHATTPQKEVALPGWAWWSLGYLIFIWASLSLIQIWSVTPDMLVAALVFVAAGLLVRIRAGHTSFATFAALGGLLGLAYLSKTVMLPIALFFLAGSYWLVAGKGRAASRTAVAILVFLVVSTPFVVLMSRAKGHFTYGEAGTLTYVRHVNGVTYPHWQGQPPGDGQPVHPSRQILAAPPIYEFATPVGGTYPISYDPSYWYEGVAVRFDLGNQLRQLLNSALFYADLFAFRQGILVVGVALLYVVAWRRPRSFAHNVRRYALSLVALLALLLYAPVLVAGRYVGAFLVLFWTDLLANARLPDSHLSKRVIYTLSVFMIASIAVNIAIFNLEGFADLRAAQPARATAQATPGPPRWPGVVAEELWDAGLEPGDGVALIGYGFDSFWARLARVHIVAEMLDTDAAPFWRGDAALQNRVIAAFATTGAEAIVAENVPAYASLPGWHQIADTNYYLYLLHK